MSDTPKSIFEKITTEKDIIKVEKKSPIKQIDNITLQTSKNNIYINDIEISKLKFKGLYHVLNQDYIQIFSKNDKHLNINIESISINDIIISKQTLYEIYNNI